MMMRRMKLPSSPQPMPPEAVLFTPVGFEAHTTREGVTMVRSLHSVSVGLCSTCNNAPTCAYRAARGCDAVCCEMFDDRSAVVSGGARNNPAEPMSRDARSEKSSLDEVLFSGLCVNCENRHTCRAALSAGGVWHCEEYR